MSVVLVQVPDEVVVLACADCSPVLFHQPSQLSTKYLLIDAAPASYLISLKTSVPESKD